MKVLVLQSSFKKQGHTKEFSVPFEEEMRKLGAEVSEEWLCDYDIKPCRGCGTCQEVLNEIGCAQSDDFMKLYRKLEENDLIVFATPIYIGSAPGYLKMFIDRLTYSGIKLYGEVKGPSLIPGKSCAVLITSGAPPKAMITAFEFSLKIVCARLKWTYLGWVGGTDPGKPHEFMNEKKAQRSRDFAHEVFEAYSHPAEGDACNA